MFDFRFRVFYYLMDKFCSAEVAGYKLSVPCFPEKYLVNSYGSTWPFPKAVNYKYENVDYKIENMTDVEWSNSYRYYHKNGELDWKKTNQLIVSQLNQRFFNTL